MQDHRGEICYPMDGLLKSNLQKVKKIIKKDLDYVFIVAGKVGSGKSVFAQLIGHYLSGGQLTADQVVFTAEDFREQIMKAPKYQCIIWDECFRGASSRASMSSTNKTIHSLMQEIRQKNLFILLVLPNFWDLDSYLIRERSKGIFEVYARIQKDEAGEPDLQRGLFRYYSSTKLISFMNNAKNRYQWPSRRYCDFYGKWTNQYSINGKSVPLLDNRYRYLVGAKEYLEKKNAALGDYGVDGKPAEEKVIGKYEMFLLKGIYYLLRNRILNINQVQTAFGMTERNLRTFRDHAIKEEKMPNTTWKGVYEGKIITDKEGEKDKGSVGEDLKSGAETTKEARSVAET